MRNRNGIILNDWITSNPLIDIMNTIGPTRVSSIESYIDIVLASTLTCFDFSNSNGLSFFKIHDYNSDHMAVEFNFRIQNTEETSVK